MKGFFASGQNPTAGPSRKTLRAIRTVRGQYQGMARRIRKIETGRKETKEDVLDALERFDSALSSYSKTLAKTTDQVARTGVITVPTTYVWSDRDGVVGLTAALRTADWVSAEYQLVAMRGVSHWIPEEAPRELADAVLARIGV